MEIKRKIVKSKKTGRLEPEPSFEKNPTFFRPVTFPSWKEGEEWAFEILSTSPTGKKDKKGRDIYVSKVKPAQRVEYCAWGLVKFDPSTKSFRVPLFSGEAQVPVGEKFIPAHFSPELDVFERRVAIMATLQCEEVSTFLNIPSSFFVTYVTEKDVCNWLSGEELEKALQMFEKLRKQQDLLNKKEEEKEASLIKKGIVISDLTPDSITESFILHGISNLTPSIIDHGMPFYGQENSVFDVGGFRYHMIFKTLDSDFYEVDFIESSSGIVRDRELISVLEALAKFASRPQKKYIPLVDIYIDKEQQVLFHKEIPIAGEYGRFSEMGHGKHTVLANAEEVQEKLQAEIDQIQVDLTPITKRYKNLIEIEYIPEVIKKVEIVEDTEEGVGAKDDTYYSTTKVVAEVKIVYKKKIRIDERVSQQIRALLV